MSWAFAREEITDKPLRGAREALGVVSRREGFGTGSKVYWSLPTSIDAPELHTGPSPVEGNYGGRGHL